MLLETGRRLKTILSEPRADADPEWRLDPASDARRPIVTTHDLRVIVLCSAGYASSLAAAALRDVGLFRSTDVIGGFRAWRDAGLPTTDNHQCVTARGASVRPHRFTQAPRT
jgi:3-mercaptopyruvate sulfurtransferase SseA